MKYLLQYVRYGFNLGKALESEKVPNVLIAFLSNYPKIKGNLNGQGKKQFQTVFRKLREFDDEDVQYYANIIEE